MREDRDRPNLDIGIPKGNILAGRTKAERHAPPGTPPWNVGKTVFRVEHSAALPGFVTGAALVIAGWFAARIAGAHVPLTMFFGIMTLGAVTGLLLGRRRRSGSCSDPRCEARLIRTESFCPHCGGTVAGTITRRQDRLDAEEALRARE